MDVVLMFVKPLVIKLVSAVLLPTKPANMFVPDALVVVSVPAPFSVLLKVIFPDAVVNASDVAAAPAAALLNVMLPVPLVVRLPLIE
jgi:hypothetical protein